MRNGADPLRALATITLDASALDVDRLADLVAERLAARQDGGAKPMLSCADAARLAGVHPDTVRRAIRSGALEVAGYVGGRPRVRVDAVETWLANGRQAARHAPPRSRRGRSPGRAQARRVLGDALRDLGMTQERAA
jgi:excisionase family DNA binding protein